jgi:hypothetical protein
MKKQAALILFIGLSSPVRGQTAVIQYDWNQAEIGGNNCPLKLSNLKVSSDGREITIDSSSWALSLTQPQDGLLADSVCVIRVPTTVPATYQVLQVTQSLNITYSKGTSSTISAYGNSRLFDLKDAPIDVKLGNDISGMRTLSQTSTANIANWSQWCRSEDRRGLLAINLGLSILRNDRNQDVWAQLGQRNSPYKVRLDAVSCDSNPADFLGQLRDQQEKCKVYNQDGMTCAGVGLHSPNAESCRWGNRWLCLANGCASYKGADTCVER